MNAYSRRTRADRTGDAARRRQRGFTLIELMIVVVIVGILAAVAYPSYQNQVQATRRADGKAELLRIAQGLERCYTRFNRYNDDGCPIADDLEDDGILSPDEWYLVESSVLGANAFSLTATPQDAQASDARCGVLSLTHTGARDADGTLGADGCW